MAQRNFNLLTFSGHPSDATTFYRCIGPLNALRQKRHGLQLTHLEKEINWASLCTGDAAIFQRPTTKNQLQVAQMCAQHGMPIWVEYDDDFFGLPEENPTHDAYMNPEAHGVIRKICALADVVTASTAELAKVFAPLNKNVRVIPNGLMTNMVGFIPDHSGQPRSDMVMWRGSKTHGIDLDAFTPEIIDASKANPAVSWAFQGWSTAKLTSGIGPKAVRGAMLDNLEYFYVISVVRPKVLMVPLADHRFNRSKSNIAGIEATYAGAVPVVPDWPEWQVPGWLHYAPGDPASFRAVLQRAIDMPAEEQQIRWIMARKHIEAHLTVDIVNGKRRQILDEFEVLSASPEARARKRALVAPRRVVEGQ